MEKQESTRGGTARRDEFERLKGERWREGEEEGENNPLQWGNLPTEKLQVNECSLAGVGNLWTVLSRAGVYLSR